MRNSYKILVGKREGRVHLEGLGEGRRLLLKCVLKKLGGNMCFGLIWLSIGV
jgi:hypothetical protein